MSYLKYDRCIEQIDNNGIRIVSNVLSNPVEPVFSYDNCIAVVIAEYNYDTAPKITLDRKVENKGFESTLHDEQWNLFRLCQQISFWGLNENAMEYLQDFWNKVDAFDEVHNAIMPLLKASPRISSCKQTNESIRIIRSIEARHETLSLWAQQNIWENSWLWEKFFGKTPERKKTVQGWLLYSKETGYIYLVKGLFETPTYKIGYSKKPKKRIRKFGVVLPFPIETTHLIKTDHMRAVEAYLHDKYESKRVNGEWFELSQDDVAELCAIETLNAEDIA